MTSTAMKSTLKTTALLLFAYGLSALALWSHG
jgi:hypothetical protein